MDQANQVNNIGALVDVPSKRSRGRPRKDPSRKKMEKIRRPPKFDQPWVDPEPADMIGQPVSGVVEATFDAGYLLNVRVGNSNITLRGVVFRTGHYVPISTENDVAPNLEMIKRVEIPLPKQNHVRVHGNTGRSRKRKQRENGTSCSLNESEPGNNGLNLASQGTNLSVSKGKEIVVASVPSQFASPLGSRGRVVPVVLQPVNLSNPLPLASPAPHLASTLPKQAPLHATQALSSSSDTPFQTLLGEVIKKKHVSQSSENINSYENNISGVHDASEPLYIEPLQAFPPNPYEHPEFMSGLIGHGKVDKMTELLKVVEENMMEKRSG